MKTSRERTEDAPWKRYHVTFEAGRLDRSRATVWAKCGPVAGQIIKHGRERLKVATVTMLEIHTPQIGDIVMKK